MKRRTFLKAAAMTAAASPFTGSASRGNLLAQESRAGVRSVLLITKCHLDVGFSGTEANIRQLYFQKHFPNAMRTAAQLRAAGADRYIWTTGSWLLYEYLEQASPVERRQIEAAVTAGDLSWHALPFSWQTEMLDRSMIDGGLSFSAELDRRFGTKTIAAKMTDVPGHTRGLIAPLASAGVQMLNIGVNAASTPPDVPELFVWKSPAGSSVMVMYHLHDYGGVVRIPGTGVAVAVDMRGDNEGPHTPAQIAEIYANLRGQFPGADVHAATLNDAAAAIAPIRNTLPVVTAEIGDTWIYGVASDPPKVANFRAAMRLRQQWIDDRQWALGDANDRLLLRRLLLGAEHTWGTDTKSHLDNDHYLPADLREVLGRPEYRLMQTSWQEKRDDVAQAFDDLPEQQRSAVRGAMDLPSATAPSTAGMRPHADLSHLPPLSFRHFDVGVDPATGAITRLRDRLSGRELASADHPLAVITYQTLSAETYAAFLDRYLKIHEDWAPRDFGKPGIEHFGAMDGSWHPRVVRLWTASSAAEDRLLMELAPSDHDAATRAGHGRGRSLWTSAAPRLSPK